jgi:hypothetical protein
MSSGRAHCLTASPPHRLTASSPRPCGAAGIDTAGKRRNVNAVGSQSEPAYGHAPMGRRPIPIGGTRDKKSRPKGRRIRSLWWTRSRRIRTAASIPADVPIAETREPPVYQQIAMKAARLRELGMTYPEIGQRLGVDRWTVGKAVRWLQRQRDVGSTYSNSSID